MLSFVSRCLLTGCIQTGPHQLITSWRHKERFRAVNSQDVGLIAYCLRLDFSPFCIFSTVVVLTILLTNELHYCGRLFVWDIVHTEYVSDLVAICTAYCTLQIVVFTLHYNTLHYISSNTVCLGKKPYFGINAGAAQNVLSVSFNDSRAGLDPKWRPPIGTHSNYNATVHIDVYAQTRSLTP